MYQVLNNYFNIDYDQRLKKQSTYNITWTEYFFYDLTYAYVSHGA